MRCRCRMFHASLGEVERRQIRLRMSYIQPHRYWQKSAFNDVPTFLSDPVTNEPLRYGGRPIYFRELQELCTFQLWSLRVPTLEGTASFDGEQLCWYSFSVAAALLCSFAFTALLQGIPLNYPVHRHCFTGNWEEAKEWLDTFPNLCLGLTPLVAFPDALHLQEVARQIPLDRLLIETDAPYFLPKKVCSTSLSFLSPSPYSFASSVIFFFRFADL